MPKSHTLQGQTSATSHDTHQDFTRSRLRHRPDRCREPAPKLFKHHCMHLHSHYSFFLSEDKNGNDEGPDCASVPLHAACTRAQIVSGLSGISTVFMSSGESASSTALTIAGGPPIQPASPTPFAPSGLLGEGVSTRAVTKSGTCAAIGRAYSIIVPLITWPS